MSEEKKKGILQTLAEFFEIKEVETGKPPAKTQETPVHVETPEGSVQPAEESPIEVKMPEPVEPVSLGEEGRKRRIQV